MTDRTEEQIARDKAAVDAMKNAKSNMDSALSRIAALESALMAARDDLGRVKAFIGAGAYAYPDGNNRQSVHDYIGTMVARATKALG